MRAFRIPTSASRVAVVKPHEYQSSLARCHSLTVPGSEPIQGGSSREDEHPGSR